MFKYNYTRRYNAMIRHFFKKMVLRALNYPDKYWITEQEYGSIAK